MINIERSSIHLAIDSTTARRNEAEPFVFGNIFEMLIQLILSYVMIQCRQSRQLDVLLYQRQT